MKLPATLRALGYRNFQLFFGGQLISLIGTWMQNIAQAWLVYRLTGSSVLLGAVSFAGQIPIFFLAPLGGIVADRRSRRRIVIGTQTASMLLAFALAGLTLTKTVHVWHVFVLASLLGAVNAFDIPARQKKDRNLARETHRAQQHRGAGEAVHQPRLGNVLHPGADEGNQLPAEEKLEISVPEGAQRRREFHSAFIVMWEAGAAWWDRRSVSVVCQAPCFGERRQTTKSDGLSYIVRPARQSESLFVGAPAEGIGHASDVVADYAAGRVGFSQAGVGVGQPARILDEEAEQFRDHGDGAAPVLGQFGCCVHPGEEELLESAAGGGGFRGERGHAIRQAANGLRVSHRGARGVGRGSFDQARNQSVDQLAQRFVELFARAGAGELSFHGFGNRAILRHAFGDLVGGEHAGRKRVIEIGRVVGDFVGQIDQLAAQIAHAVFHSYLRLAMARPRLHSMISRGATQLTSKRGSPAFC